MRSSKLYNPSKAGKEEAVSTEHVRLLLPASLDKSMLFAWLRGRRRPRRRNDAFVRAGECGCLGGDLLTHQRHRSRSCQRLRLFHLLPYRPRACQRHPAGSAATDSRWRDSRRWRHELRAAPPTHPLCILPAADDPNRNSPRCFAAAGNGAPGLAPACGRCDQPLLHGSDVPVIATPPAPLF